MNWSAKFVLSMGLLSLLCLMLPGSLRADTVYTYTGLDYTQCFGSYTCNGATPFISVTFDTTLSGSQLDNLTLGGTGVISSSVTTYTITDNEGITITPSNESSPLYVNFTTDGSGIPISWMVLAFTGGTAPFSQFQYVCTSNAPQGCNYPTMSVGNPWFYDSSGFDVNDGYPYAGGVVADGYGSWTITTTPEPASYLLLVTGLLGLLALAARTGYRRGWVARSGGVSG